MPMTNTLIAPLLLVIVVLLIAHRVRYGKAVSQGSIKANTVHAIEQANSKLYRSMVAQNQVINDVLADMQSDPFWAEYFN